MSFKTLLQRGHWLLSAQFGLDLRLMCRSVWAVPRYLRDYINFRSKYSGRLEFLPCLHDWYEEAGVTKSEYFWQDLLVARMIFEAKPEKHVDIGSRIDGFVAHVASFREIEVFDVRPVTATIPGLVFRQADFMRSEGMFADYCDSVSCLHALEHFGLGRYGDPIDPKGFESGLVNMARLLKPGGAFYLSIPVGLERVEFNANRVFNPRAIISFANANGLTLQTLTVVTGDEGPHVLSPTEEELTALAVCRYNLGIFVFAKQEIGV